MTYRRLQISEWDRITEIFKAEFGEPQPSATNSVIVIAEDHGEIVGIVTLQMIMHVEPVWVKSTWRGRWVLQGMLREVSRQFPTLSLAFAFVKTTWMCMLLNTLGLEELPAWRVFRWKGK